MESLRRAVRSWIPLFLCAVTSTTGAQGREIPGVSTLQLRVRDIVLPSQQDGPAPDLYVDAHHATVLRFEEAMVPVEVHIPEWKGRFEQPIVNGQSVLVVPLFKLHEHERISLVVTLQDGTRLPFSLVASPAIPDQQVNVLLRMGSPMDLGHQLIMERQRGDAAQRQLLQCERERASPEHALAVVLSQESMDRLFAFAETEKIHSGELSIKVRRFQVENLSALLFMIESSDPGLPWILEKLEVTRAKSGEKRAFVWHAWPDPAGSLGTLRIAVVMQAPPKGNKEPTLIHLHERHGGRRFWYISPKI